MLSKSPKNKRKTMEETISLIFHGCNLARDLESNLPNLSNHPNILSKSCNEIIKIFRNARDRLNADNIIFPELQQPGDLDQIGAGVQEWLRYDSAQAMNIFHGQFEAHGMHESKISTGLGRRGPGLQVPVTEVGGGDMEAAMQLRGSGGEVQPMGASDSSRDSSSLHPRGRKNDTEKRIVMVPVPQMGNIDIPPEDGYIWRKYGQKEIFRSRFPRSYYRCTHQKLFQCPAKKQVQRLDNDPYTFEVTYRGDHTCHMSSTVPPTPPPMSTAKGMTPKPTTTTQPISPPSWTSMDCKPKEDSTISTFIGTQMYRTSSDIGGPSNVQYGRVVDYPPVTDLVDAMLYSGSFSNNSMDIIFSSMESSEWKGEDNKK